MELCLVVRYALLCTCSRLKTLSGGDLEDKLCTAENFRVSTRIGTGSALHVASSEKKTHRIHKRQTATTSNTFNPSTCNAGTSIGTITASSTGGGQVGYTIDPASTSGMYVIIGYLTGYMTFATNAPGGSFTFNVQASNAFGTTTIPVTVTCTGSTNGFGTITCPVGSGTCTNVASTTTTTTISPFLFAQSSSLLTNPLLYSSALTNPYTSYPYTSGITNPYSTYPYTGTTGLTYPYTGTTGLTYPYTAGTSYPYGSSYPYGTSSLLGSTSTSCSSTSSPYGGLGYPYTQTASYPQTFYVTNCYTGGYVGQVCYPGATGYLIGGGSSQFTISANNGIITLLAPLTTTTGTFSATVQVYTSYNPYTPITIPVTVTASCYGNTGIGTGLGTGTFLQTAYTFSTALCTAGSTVGTVYAPGALSYTISNGNGQFVVSSAGAITVGSTVTPGTYTLLVQAYSYLGIPSTATVTITVTSCTGTTTGAASFPSTSYSLTSSTCTAGSSVGTITATNANSYQITSGSTTQFAVSSTGQITLLTAVPANTYSLTLTAVGSLGSSSVPVTITVTCGGTSGTGTGTTPTWNQNFYAFTVNSCTSGTSVGSVSASGATSYAINYGNTQFTINSSGAITTSGTPTQGVYSLTAVATGSNGAQIAVPVTVNVVCSG